MAFPFNRQCFCENMRDTNLIYYSSYSVPRYEAVSLSSRITRVAVCIRVRVRLQLLLKPTFSKPMKRDGIPRSNEFSTSVSSYSFAKGFLSVLPRLCRISVLGHFWRWLPQKRKQNQPWCRVTEILISTCGLMLLNT